MVSTATASSLPTAASLIRRLPAGVEYAFIKAIVFDLPPPLTTLLWASDGREDPLFRTFQGKTYRVIDRALRKREATLVRRPDDTADQERKRLKVIRYQWLLQVLEDLWHGSVQESRTWVSLCFVSPPRDVAHRDAPDQCILRITVWRGSAEGARRIEEEVILPSEPAPGADPTLPWIDVDKFLRITTALLRRHCAHVLSRRCGCRWRSRRSPSGWPLVTQHAIPRMYDYLRPYYQVRRYQDHRQSRPAGHYPAQLRRDILDVLRLERPDLAVGLTLARVTATIQRHVASASSNRPMGLDMFRIAARRKANSMT